MCAAPPAASHAFARAAAGLRHSRAPHPSPNPDGIVSLSPRLAAHCDAYLGSRVRDLAEACRDSGLSGRRSGAPRFHRIMGHRIILAHDSVEHDSVKRPPSHPCIDIDKPPENRSAGVCAAPPAASHGVRTRCGWSATQPRSTSLHNPNGIATFSPRLAKQRDAYLGSPVRQMPNPVGIPACRGAGARDRGSQNHEAQNHARP